MYVMPGTAPQLHTWAGVRMEVKDILGPQYISGSEGREALDSRFWVGAKFLKLTNNHLPPRNMYSGVLSAATKKQHLW